MFFVSAQAVRDLIRYYGYRYVFYCLDQVSSFSSRAASASFGDLVSNCQSNVTQELELIRSMTEKIMHFFVFELK